MDRPVPPKLHAFLHPYEDKVAELALQVRAVILREVPHAYELLYDSYNTVSVAYSYSEDLNDAFCHVATYTRHVNLGFNRGADLEDPNGLLRGSGKRIRHMRIESTEDLEPPYVRDFIRRAAAQGDEAAPSSLADDGAPRAIVKSVSDKKRRPPPDRTDRP